MRRVHAGVLVALALALTACAGVPSSGPIQQGPVVAPAGEDNLIARIANPPTPGMTPEQVVRGFQEATASPDAKYQIARMYLTPSASAAWDPSSGVLIYDSSGLTPTVGTSTVEVVGRTSGTIGSTGEYSVAAPGTPLTTSYGIERVGGQWRISAPPDGLVLGVADIERGYRSYDLYFFARDFSVLVPTPVTVPLTGSGLATLLVRTLVAGPTPWIAAAVTTAFPEGTRLTVDSVPVVDGIAQVDLTPEVLRADDTTRQKLSAQLVWTLRQLPDVSFVQITVNGQPLPVPGVPSVQPVSSWPLVDPDALSTLALGHAVDKRGILTIGTDSTVSVVAKVKPDLVLPGISLDSGRVAGLSADRRSLYESRLVDGAAAVRRYAGTALSRPSWDVTGAIWVVDRGVGLVMVKDGKATRMPLAEAQGVTDASLVSASVSRDGTRIALLVARGTRVEPLLARIERSGDSVRVASPRRIESVLTEALDLAWADAGTLAVLGTSGASSLDVLLLDVGTSRVRRITAPEDSVTVAAAPGPGRPLLVGAGASIYRNTSSSWARLTDALSPVYPG
jgi:hypothetical protein